MFQIEISTAEIIINKKSMAAKIGTCSNCAVDKASPVSLKEAYKDNKNTPTKQFSNITFICEAF